MTKRVAFILKGYPRLSETFIAQEIRALEQRGLDILIVSLRHPTDTKRHPVHGEITAKVIYLPEYLYQEPRRLFRAWRRARRMAGYRTACRDFRRDLVRDRTPNRVRRFGQAMVLAAEVDGVVDWLHAHFMHTPASVARYASTMSQTPWTCSAHAKDIWTIDAWEKREKLAELEWLVTCTRANAEHLAELAPDTDRVALVYHGLDLSRFAPADAKTQRPDGSGDAPVRILSVGRAVPKKGYDLLIAALASLPADLNWRFTHIGGGGELDDLKQRAHDAGISERIEWLGAQAQQQVFDQYRACDLFALPCRITDDGDRDGLPNVLMEAQAHGLACLSTTISGVPELIQNGDTGILVPPEDVDALARALTSLIQSPELRNRLGAAGEARVRADFDMRHGIDDLARRFGI